MPGSSAARSRSHCSSVRSASVRAYVAKPLCYNGGMGDRPKIPQHVETEILTKSRRKCCLCVFLVRNDEQQAGQIAHLDQDRTNNDPDNLAWLCLPHHDAYDSKTSQSKGLTFYEVKHYRDKLYEVVIKQEAQLVAGDTSPEAVGALIHHYGELFKLKEHEQDRAREEVQQKALELEHARSLLAEAEERAARMKETLHLAKATHDVSKIRQEVTASPTTQTCRVLHMDPFWTGNPLSKMLAKYGYDVVYTRHPYDVILHVLPKERFDVLLAEVHDYKSGRKIPAELPAKMMEVARANGTIGIALTVLDPDIDERDTAAKVVKAGFTKHIMKPCDVQEIVEALDEVTGRKRPSSEPG